MNTRGSDDGFHEIQLSGKQLVFLFMAATVVSVVIFLCGVLVGRGVRVERGPASEPTISSAPAPDPRPQPQAAPAGQAAVPSDPTKAPPPPAVDDFNYTALLERPDPAAEKLAPAPPPSERRPAAPATSVPGPETPKSAPARAPAPPAAPQAVEAKAKPVKATADKAVNAGPRGGYVVQVAALNVRAEAEAIATRLSAKGYQAFVMPPSDGSAVYRVRIGRFDSKREADAVATKIKKEERIQPWVTR